MDMASENIRELVKEGIEENDWNDVQLYTRMKLVDFVERRFMGMNENNIIIEHELNRVPFRLTHVEDSPRKRTAEAVLEKCRECYEQVMDPAFRQKVMDEARNILDRREYVVDDEKRREMRRRNGENSDAFREATERLHTYQNFLGSFFIDHVVTKYAEDNFILYYLSLSNNI